MFLWSLPNLESVKSLPHLIKNKQLSKATTLSDLTEILQVLEKFSEEEFQDSATNITSDLANLAKKYNWNYPMLMKTLRISLTGVPVGPPVFEIFQILGK